MNENPDSVQRLELRRTMKTLENPFRVTDMLEMYADVFLEQARLLNVSEESLEYAEREKIGGIRLRSIKGLVKDNLTDLEKSLKGTDLLMTRMKVQKVIEKCDSDYIQVSVLKRELAEVGSRMRDEFGWRRALMMTFEESELYDESDTLPDWLVAHFPDVIEDWSESIKCRVCGRHTASVFHLMRVMEASVQQFGAALGIQLLGTTGRQKSWQSVLNGSNDAIARLDQNDAKTRKLVQLSLLLQAVKIAWRNEVMHPKDSYSADEAKRISDATSAFMKELSEVI